VQGRRLVVRSRVDLHQSGPTVGNPPAQTGPGCDRCARRECRPEQIPVERAPGGDHEAGAPPSKVAEPVSPCRSEAVPVGGGDQDDSSVVANPIGGCARVDSQRIVDDHDAEGVLRRLVERAQSDELAARVVVQRIVPGLISATRHRPSDMSADDALQELVAAAWIAVRSYDPKRSPSCISAALINDAVYRVFKSDRRRREKRPEVLVDPQDWRSLTATDDQVLDRVREVLIEARVHGIDPVNLEALRRVLLTGSTERVAEAMGISPRAVRYRCSRVSSELAAIAQVA